jgi:sorbitol-specific phosphotransferase system component IIBC
MYHLHKVPSNNTYPPPKKKFWIAFQNFVSGIKILRSLIESQSRGAFSKLKDEQKKKKKTKKKKNKKNKKNKNKHNNNNNKEKEE